MRYNMAIRKVEDIVDNGFFVNKDISIRIFQTYKYKWSRDDRSDEVKRLQDSVSIRFRSPADMKYCLENFDELKVRLKAAFRLLCDDAVDKKLKGFDVSRNIFFVRGQGYEIDNFDSRHIKMIAAEVYKEKSINTSLEI